ncbi:MAG: transposase, partial [Ruminococcus sp.]|nr:transposase [Ruminococcus sp.]
LRTIPGIGPIVSMCILTEVCDVKRFHNENMTINDISTMIGMTYDGTNKRLHRAEQSLFKIISEVDYVKQ